MSKGYRASKPLELPRRRKSVSLYVEQDDETKVKTQKTRKGNDIFLARLTLDHLSLVNRAHIFLGLVSTLYVASGPHSSRSSFKG
jgi:DNA-dependent RNA polymerase auxiliary subunit epsilon